MTKPIDDVLDRVKSWPAEDQAALMSFADEIEALRSGKYVLSADEAAAVDEGLAQLDRGEFASEDDAARRPLFS
jgi:predicted transcriptional regulator